MPIETWSDRVIVVHLTSDPALLDDLQTAVEQAGRQPLNVVVNLAGVRFINSSHIARLLKLRKVVLTGGNRLMLCAVDAQVWGAFLVTGLDKVFDFTDSVPTALATLQLAEQSR